VKSSLKPPPPRSSGTFFLLPPNQLLKRPPDDSPSCSLGCCDAAAMSPSGAGSGARPDQATCITSALPLCAGLLTHHMNQRTRAQTIPFVEGQAGEEVKENLAAAEGHHRGPCPSWVALGEAQWRV
jgi:hypothetical protein